MRKVLICFLMAAVVMGVGIVPQRIVAGADRYTAVVASRYSYQPKLSCNGTVMAEEGVKLMVNSNVVIKEMNVQSGSRVEAGQIIAATESPAPEQAFLSQSIDIPGSAFSPNELESLASQYGIDIPEGGKSALPDAKKLFESVTTPQMAVAPISGIITWNSVTEGRFVPAGSELCTILGLDSYKAVVQVPADEAKLIQAGAKAFITGSEIDYQQCTGTVRSVGNTIVRGVTTGGYNSTVEVEIMLDTPTDTIRHGANISCTIVTGEQRVLLTLPYEAVHQDERNREFVYCIEGNSLIRRYIETGLELDDCIEVVSGISYDMVIATGEAGKSGERFILEP